ncbi:hypothetical protein ONZ43_g7130 [Nemania bipapillata]|uniref:Uncharacterized protein n=1 Tax=Nemania bipapillata TaxID=110536 RepID=A0ACC2HTY0_9PEZI|nr:hypothetical protein ONZ43_g7130 [Nemania bipapillata]
MSNGRISSWVRFKLSTSESLEPSIFKPLVAGSSKHVHDAYYGPIAETSDEYLLVIIWQSRQHYDEFKNSAQYSELFASLKPHEPTVQIVDFDKIAFWWRFGPNTELRTVYFPASISSEARMAVKGLKGLVLTMGLGIDGSKAHLSPYRGVPTCGWVEALDTSKNQEVTSCIWCHYWKDGTAEEAFKTKEMRPPKDGEADKVLALEAFEKDLKMLGALGWEDIHVDFKQVPK